LAGILPFDVTDVTVVFPSPDDLSVFEVSVVGRFDFGGFPSDAGFTPRIGLGGDVVTPSSPPEDNRFTFSVAVDALDAGEVRPIDLGPFTLGFDGLPAGDHVFGAELTLDGYANGVLQTGVAGSVDVDGPAGSPLTGVSVDVEGDLQPGDPTVLDLATTTTVSGALPGGIEVLDLELAAGVRIAFGSTGFDIAPRLDGLTVGEVVIPLGDVLTLVAQDVSIDLAPTPGDDVLVVPADGSIGVRMGDAFPLLAGWGGTAAGVALDSGSRVRLLEGFAIDITPPDGERLGLPSWLPFAIDSIGITFPDAVVDDGGLQVPPEGITLTSDLLDGLRLRVSGGLTATDLWPISAGVEGLEVDLGLLAAGQPPITNLDAIRFGVEPFELPGGVVIGGVLELGSVPVDGETVFYGRVDGELSVNGIGGGAELIVSQWGPLLLRISAPLGIPLGPTGLILAGATGAAQFGDVGVTVPPAGNPLALLSNAMDLPTDVVIDRDRIIAELSALDEGEYTWDQGFAIAIAGDLTVAAAPGVLQGRVSIGFNLGLPDGPNDPPGLQLVGKGDVTVHGIPLGEAGLLFDVTNPIEPTYDFAFSSPVPGSPLALIVPAQATLGIGLRTDGVVLGTAEGLRVFVTELAAGALGEGQALFASVLDQIADRLDGRRSRPLARLLLDVDGDGSVSTAEGARTITSAFVVDRLLGRNGLPPLLPATVAPGAEDDVAVVVGAVLDELLLVAADVLADPAAIGSFGLDPAAALTALADVVRDATADALAAFGDRFDPSITVEGALQPSILGIAFGDPTVQGTLSIDRRGLFFELGGSIIDATKLTLSQTFPPAAPLISAAMTAGTLGLTDQLAVGMRLPYGGVIDALIDGESLPQFQPLDPEWAVSVEGGLALFGFEVAELAGLAVLPGQATFLATRLQIADDPAAWVDRTKTPVTQARFDDLVEYGGLLVTGSLRVPQLITRPGDLLASLPPPPTDPLAYGAWLQDLAALSTSVDTPARVQLFLPGVLALVDADTAVEAVESVSIEGVWNGDVLGLDLGAGRVTAGIGGVGVTGELPLTGGTATATLNTRVLDALSSSCGPAAPPCLPTGVVDVSLSNAQVVQALGQLGMPTWLVPESTGRLRAATPGVD
ncbi:MAG: hypothetical protein MUE78_10735, partial [Ilumatobacteraceae bacterium]|nr:hypothetical protein [Ilumatobacteraceae bacterium]